MDFYFPLALGSCASDLPSYLMESSNFQGNSDGSLKVRCKLEGKVFNVTGEEKETVECDTQNWPLEEDCLTGAVCKIEDIPR